MMSAWVGSEIFGASRDGMYILMISLYEIEKNRIE